MNKLITAPGRLARLLPFRRKPRTAPVALPSFAIPAGAIDVLPDPAAFRRELLQRIAQATRRIVIVALYLQDDDGGREVLDALYAAKARRPALQVSVFVDWHRAQRGLIGKQKNEGNAGMYRECAARLGPGVEIHGVPVQNRELFGVLHLKGFVIDDAVLYSGASLNDVYLARYGRYRLDRYHLLRHRGLADAMAAFVQRYFAESAAVRRLDVAEVPSTKMLQPAIREFRQELQRAAYEVPRDTPGIGEVAVTPLLGFGRGDNALNEALLALLGGARRRLILLTPYFNLPRPVRAVLGQLLRRGCTLDIMVGDKVANDFYIPPGQPFKTIGLLPYLYENNLRRFARAHRRQIESGQLNLHLWRDGDNSYHLKGLFIDDDVAVLTGNNLNPRAWSLDLENGLVLRDPARLLQAKHEAEWAALRRHATRLADYRALESPRRYPAEVRRLLRRLNRTRLDRLVNRLL
ncbi:phosphatidylserine synthase [Rhodanobacter sp. FW510-R12]|uniref:CDP-diacylglycerol--serine O-phosphatidyltransferase n=1 Tax=unclassified Rhodanobacter TaxID=2621553 RepID=UPI0007AA5080|nr:MULTISPECIES: CDP-diacylglycerol--serine O-phosphatidyltransferase [unclassified Rhodanobacter]KZC15452.1 phosphatidylserine synthase [Rhodanobacter sp. FW104-R8]KZC27837.1 phosphatidylserine synthase [Rhodanobacter sp. FW510-T8]KZC32024.1 phosphatidylserine synthase [Rhodanobacter sp. FW510-R10]